MSLEFGLKNLQIGTLIELYTHTDESVAGYLTKISDRKIQLSQNNPLNYYNVTISHNNLFEGKKEYNLENFMRYRVWRLPSSSDENFCKRLKMILRETDNKK